jgi:hypothetical protein
MNNEYIKVKDNNDLVRDQRTQAILNVNMKEYEKYKKIKNIKEGEVNRVKKLENDVSEMKTDLNDIKNLLRALVDGSK